MAKISWIYNLKKFSVGKRKNNKGEFYNKKIPLKSENHLPVNEILMRFVTWSLNYIFLINVWLYNYIIIVSSRLRHGMKHIMFLFFSFDILGEVEFALFNDQCDKRWLHLRSRPLTNGITSRRKNFICMKVRRGELHFCASNIVHDTLLWDYLMFVVPYLNIPSFRWTKHGLLRYESSIRHRNMIDDSPVIAGGKTSKLQKQCLKTDTHPSGWWIRGLTKIIIINNVLKDYL